MELALETFWAIDVEGNGGTPPEIVEIAIASITNLQVRPEIGGWRVRPQHPITRIATGIHGITNNDVATAPNIQDVSSEIISRTGGAKIIGHNVQVELNIISRAFPDWKPSMAIDTLRLAKHIKPGLPSYNLGSLGDAFGLTERAKNFTVGRLHSALFDTVLLALLFIDSITIMPPGFRSEALLDADILGGRQGMLL